MRSGSQTLNAYDGTSLYVHTWLPDGEPKAVVLVVHGMAEHAARYARLAEALTGAGYAVYADDHRGHGKTAGSVGEAGHFGDAVSWDRVVDDLDTVRRHAVTTHPGLPVFLLAHSMGSFIARCYVQQHGDAVAGMVLSGTAGDPGVSGLGGRGLAAVEARLRGKRARSSVLDQLMFGQFNKPFTQGGKARTRFEWLSRDPEEVDRYVEDPFCGFVCTTSFYGQMLAGVAAANDAGRVARVPADLPVLLIAGDQDPVGDRGEGVRRVERQFTDAGLTDVTCILYPGARHEIFNETNRDEVTADVLAWLDERLATASPPAEA